MPFHDLVHHSFCIEDYLPACIEENVEEDIFLIHIDFMYFKGQEDSRSPLELVDDASESWSVKQELMLSNLHGPRILHALLSKYNLPSGFINSFVPVMLDKARREACNNNGCKILPLHLTIYHMSTWYDDDDGDDDDNRDIQEAVSRSLEESTLKTIPATEESIKGLKKRRLHNGASRIEQGRCTVCLEDIGAKEKTLCMPCSHVFHEGCIIQWLKTSHLCPLCRYAMPS